MRRFEGSFSASGASKVDPCLGDCTINTYGFNLRQGQAYEPRWFMKPLHMNPAEAVRALWTSAPNIELECISERSSHYRGDRPAES